jgi:hypothetical protein
MPSLERTLTLMQLAFFFKFSPSSLLFTSNLFFTKSLFFTQSNFHNEDTTQECPIKPTHDLDKPMWFKEKHIKKY